jgi:alcohol dehydrogenase class IV
MRRHDLHAVLIEDVLDVGVQFVQQLSDELQVQPLRTFGMRAEDADEVVQKAQRASSMKKNPVALSVEELKQTYLSAL